jgi:hypothetical protein
MDNHYRRYAIVMETDADGTSTLEDYDTAEQAIAAFEAIRTNGYHLPEHYDLLDSDRITFDDQDFVTIRMDVEVWDEKMNHVGFEPIDHEPIYMFYGKVIQPIPEESKEAMNYLRSSAEKSLPDLQRKIDEIAEWRKGFESCLVGENTVICTLNKEGRIFHVVADNNIKIAEQIDGYLSGVHLFSPERAIEVASTIKLNGEGAEGLTVAPVNMGQFQTEMEGRAAQMLESQSKLLKYFQIQDLASNTSGSFGLKEALAAVSKSSNLEIK